MVKRNKAKTGKYRIFTLYGAVIFVMVTALLLCFFMVSTINRRMDKSATASLLNTTRILEDTMEGYLQADLNSLDAIGRFYENGMEMEGEQIQVFCDMFEFDWIGIVDEQGKGAGCFFGKFTIEDMECCKQWTPGTTGYSEPYVGQSGRPQIILWTPMYLEGQYVGTVFGGVILQKYYSANVFTFYEGEGRTYLVDGSDGTWILKSMGTDGTVDRQKDIYSLLSASGNKETEINAFRQAIVERRAGAARLNFDGERSYLCFLPLDSSPNWYIITVIAKEILLQEAREVQHMISWVLFIFCGTLVGASILFAIWQVRKAKAEGAKYRESLFSNISANLDSVFLIYEKNGGKVVFVSDNSKRLLGLECSWLGEDIGRLFDWCGVSKEDTQREEFVKGTLEKEVIREICVENELGERNRFMRLELIPTDLEQELAVLTDVTKDKDIQNSLLEAMQRAEAASNAKNDFLSAMSHDLRTPINGIAGMTAIAAANLNDKNRVKDSLNRISESTAHLLSLINEVLDMSQIESGKTELFNEEMNLTECLQDILNINYPGIQQKNHKIHVHIHSLEHDEVIGDSTGLSRIAVNLISNAIKYTPAGGTIEIDFREKPMVIEGYGCYELTVADNGVGMSLEFQKRIFNPFEREEDVRISRIQGTGLGMAIVNKFVSLMMGNIQMESEKGRGTTFRVTINFKLQEKVSKPQGDFDGCRVLVVDDDILTCKKVTEILCNSGMICEWTDNGAEAIKKAEERHLRGEDYQAVFLDWKLPGMDGVETAGRIREKVDSKVPFIILTAYEWGEEEEAKRAGVNAFLLKPIYRETLLQKMKEVLNGYMETEKQPAMTPGSRILSGKRVLVAEDNQLNMEIAVELLRMMGIQTTGAENGEAAVERFMTAAPGTYDLILMDIQMPKMNGYEATQAIRKMNREDAKTIPIIAMTADAFKRDEQAAKEAGMNEYLTKPVSVERLTRILMQFL